MSSQVPPQNIEAEESVIGAVMVLGPATLLDAVLVETHLAPEHFYLEKHQLLWKAIVALHDDDRPVEELTVADALEQEGKLEEAGGANYIASLAARVPAPGNAVEYASIVATNAEWRRLLSAGQLIQGAVHNRDKGALAEAQALLEAAHFKPGSTDLDLEALREIAFDLLEHGGAEAFPWPFKRLNDLTAGGMRRGEFVVIGGHSSHGKSQFLDQTLEGLSVKADLRARLYMNEMSAQQRVARIINRKTGIRYAKIINGALSPDEQVRANTALNDDATFPFGITLCAGWSALDIAHHIRRHRYDVAAVDIMHLIEYEDERDLSGITATFARTALQANAVILSTAHLNEKRVQAIERPRPTLGDLRGSGSIKNDADIVCFVHREQDPDTGDPEPQGFIYFAKVRNGPTGGMEAYFREATLQFTPMADGHAEPPTPLALI